MSSRTARNLAFVCVLAGASQLLNAAQLSLISSVPLAPENAGEPFSVWSNGALLRLDSGVLAATRVSVYGANGNQIKSLTFQIPGMNLIHVSGLSYGKDGTLAACGYALDSTRQPGYFVATFAPQANTASIIRTDPFLPVKVALAPDESFWVEGYELVNGTESDPAVNRDGGVLRHFDPSGKLIASLIPRSTIKDKMRLVGGFLSASDNSISWYSPAMGPQMGVYVEVDPESGAVAEFHGLPRPAGVPLGLVVGFGLGNSNTPILSTSDPRTPGVKTFIFDRKLNNWQQATGVGTFDYVAGAFEDALIFGTLGKPVISTYALRPYKVCAANHGSLT